MKICFYKVSLYSFYIFKSNSLTGLHYGQFSGDVISLHVFLHFQHLCQCMYFGLLIHFHKSIDIKKKKKGLTLYFHFIQIWKVINCSNVFLLAALILNLCSLFYVKVLYFTFNVCSSFCLGKVSNKIFLSLLFLLYGQSFLFYFSIITVHFPG